MHALGGRQDCLTAVAAVVPDVLRWAEGSPDVRPWAVAPGVHHPAAARVAGADLPALLTAPGADLVALVRRLAEQVEPEASLVDAVAARDEDVLDLLQDGLADRSPTSQGRQVVVELAEKKLL